MGPSVVNIAIATMKAEAAPQTRQAASECLAWIGKTLRNGKSFAVRAVRRLRAALETDAAAASAASARPLRSTPGFERLGGPRSVRKELTAYYGDLNDLRKCTQQEMLVEDYLMTGPSGAVPAATRSRQRRQPERWPKWWRSASGVRGFLVP